MTADTKNYDKEDIKSENSRGFIDGYEQAADDLDCIFSNYFDGAEEPSETLAKIKKEMVGDFVRYAKSYLSDQRDQFVVRILDSEAAGE